MSCLVGNTIKSIEQANLSKLECDLIINRNKIPHCAGLTLPTSVLCLLLPSAEILSFLCKQMTSFCKMSRPIKVGE